MVNLSQTLIERDYSEFLGSHRFVLVLDENGDDFSCTVFQNDEVLIAFTYQRAFGDNLAVAAAGAPIDSAVIKERKGGWSLIGEVWDEAYQDYHKARKELPYPHELGKEKETFLISRLLNSFMDKIRKGEISVRNPKFRMKM